MESGIRVLLLTAALALLATLSGCASVRHWFHRSPSASASGDSSQDQAPPRVVEPEVTRRKITVPRIRSRNFELGADYGVLSIEDFGAHPSYGLTAAYHITEAFFFPADVGRTRT